MINNLCVRGSLLGEDVLEEVQGSGLQVSFFLCDGVAFVGELLLQLLQLLQVLKNLLETLCYGCEPAGGGEEKRRRTRRKREWKRREKERKEDERHEK